MKNGAKRELYRSQAEARKRAQELLNNFAAHEAIKAEYRANGRAKIEAYKQTLKVGDILSASWGYDQTNIEFYEVLRIKGSMVTVRELAQECREDGFMCGQCVPVPHKYVEREPELTRRIGAYGLKISSCITASPWDGQAERYSYYG
jgi:hypothetical protein